MSGWRTSTRRVVTREGNAPAQALLSEVFEVCDRPWRGIGTIPRSGLRLTPDLRELRRRAPLRRRGHHGRGVAGVHRRRDPQGQQEASRVHRLRDPLHARASARRADGLVGGRMRGLPPLRTPGMSDEAAHPSSGTSPVGRSFVGLSCPIPLEEYPTVQLAHGGGGRLTKHLVDQLFVPAFDNETLARLNDGAVLEVPAGPHRLHDRLVRHQAGSSSPAATSDPWPCTGR